MYPKNFGREGKPVKNKALGASFCAMAFIFAFPAISALAYDAAPRMAEKGNLSPLYGFVAVFSLALMVGYLLWYKKREIKFLLLYCCVAAANVGYYMLSVADTISFAMWANRLSYLGCAFAILMMLLIIADVCGLKMKKAAKAGFIAIASAAFLLAATGGWLPIYYKAVSLTSINGMTVLVKDYAPLHILYTVYIVAYFAIMAVIIVRARKKQEAYSVKYAIFLAGIVFSNIAVWGVEQLIKIEFEFLSISFVTTEVFLLLMWLIMQDYDKLSEGAKSIALATAESGGELPPDIEDLFHSFSQKVLTLTASERMLLQYYIDGYSTAEAADKLYISINTARKHNSNLNRKLELSSREELGLYIELFKRAGRIEEIVYMK